MPAIITHKGQREGERQREKERGSCVGPFVFMNNGVLVVASEYLGQGCSRKRKVARACLDDGSERLKF